MQKYSGTYSVEVSNDFGCINRAEVTIDFDDFKFVLPNVIMISSANEENGRFYLKGNGFVEYSLEIFDRWGNILYHKKGILSNDPASAWVPSECCTPGVYIYKITYSEDGVIKIIYGDITVL
ncbi:MAG: gliding motility-associated C-terminal domain-containing protein [Saprospiraceae bacterium]|nr:gliding motility-associated C-terminal domain-containing protein [Saprospiraceae bacterium]